jgi:hypothetical protein
MKTSTVETWVWVLLYGGLLVLSLSVFVARADAAFGWGLAIGGMLATALGALLVYLRSRMKEEPKP